MTDMWQSSEDGRPGSAGGGDLGVPVYGKGLHPNRAFSVDAIASMGVAALTEQPALVLLAGLNLLGLQVVQQVASFPIQTAVAVATQDLGQEVSQIIQSLASSATGLFFFPIQQILTAGAMVATGMWVRNGEVSIGALYTSFAAAVRAVLAALLLGLVSFVATLVCMGPALAVGVGLAVAEQYVAAAAGAGLLVIVGFFPLVYVALGLQLAPYAAVLDGLGPVAAVTASWEASRGARLTLFVTQIVVALASFAACCLFGVPLIVVAGASVAGFSAGWLLYARPAEESRKWGFVERNAARFFAD